MVSRVMVIDPYCGEVSCRARGYFSLVGDGFPSTAGADDESQDYRHSVGHGCRVFFFPLSFCTRLRRATMSSEPLALWPEPPTLNPFLPESRSVWATKVWGDSGEAVGCWLPQSRIAAQHLQQNRALNSDGSALQWSASPGPWG